MLRPTTPAPVNRQEAFATVCLFAVLLGFSLWGVRLGWESLNLPGNEFRQAQTALSTYFIQQNHDFSLAYPMPVLGKPWSVPMEFPLYQWTVAGLSNATGLELTKAGRLVSIVCFYLTLPIIYLLLGRLALPWSRRLVALGLVMCCPLYILYARSFLIETMALLFAVLFLWSYLNAVERQRVGWLILAGLTGILAGLVKVTTFLFILLPAFSWTVTWLWQQRPGVAGGSGRRFATTAAWGLAAVILPCAAAWWWVRFADATKALNPLADFLGSERMMGFNLGTRATRFSAVIWQHHLAILFREIAAGWTLAGVGVLALVFARRWWGWIALLVGSFFAVQIIFPELYAWHEYYYVANAFTLMLAIGLVLCGVLESRVPRALAWVLVLAVFGGQIWRYATTHYQMQVGISQGGGVLSRTLKEVTASNDVLFIVGQDWSSELPYFARRRALMLRRGREEDHDTIERALKQLQGEQVGALVLEERYRNSRWLIDRLIQTFDLEPRPVYTAEGALVYLHQKNWLEAISTLEEMKKDNALELMPETALDEHPLVQHEVALGLIGETYNWLFEGMTPLPVKFYSEDGLNRFRFEDRDFFSAHPVTRLWFKVPAGSRQISVELGLLPNAYEESLPPGDRTDGVELVITEEPVGGATRPLYSRWLNPRDNPEDRGLQRCACRVVFATDTVVQIAVLPGPAGSIMRDWAMLGPIEIK